MRSKAFYIFHHHRSTLPPRKNKSSNPPFPNTANYKSMPLTDAIPKLLGCPQIERKRAKAPIISISANRDGRVFRSRAAVREQTRPRHTDHTVRFHENGRPASVDLAEAGKYSSADCNFSILNDTEPFPNCS
jgi:hypothetical protein